MINIMLLKLLNLHKKRLKKQLERNIKIVKFDYGGEYGGKYDELIVIWGFLRNTSRNLKF